jgi:ABC-type branched-subunit amino acid transport system substrate-binding protein
MRQTGSISRPIRVGVLFSQSGPLREAEQCHLKGTLLGICAVNDAGGVCGRPIEPIICDPASDVTRYRRLMTSLIVDEQVSSVFGCCASDIRKQLMPIAERQNSILWYPTQFEGFEHSPNIMYGGACANQQAIPLAEYLLAQGHRAFLLVGNDYVFPRQSNYVFRSMIEAGGGRIVGEEYLPLDAREADFARLFARYQERDRPDAVLSTIVGVANFPLFKAYRASGHRPERLPIASITTCETELQAEPELFAGHICALPYFETMGGEANASFLKSFHRRYGPRARANWLIVSTYMQVQIFARAAQLAGVAEPEAILASVHGLGAFESPCGENRVDLDTNYSSCRPRIARANTHGYFELIQNDDVVVPPDPFLLAYA